MAKFKGFAVMDAEERSRIASLGGKAAHAKGRAHQWDSVAASLAGRTGGLRSAAARKARKLKAEQEAQNGISG